MDMRAYLAWEREENRREAERKKEKRCAVCAVLMAFVLCMVFAAGIMGVI